jgi:hypothetical protein
MSLSGDLGPCFMGDTVTLANLQLDDSASDGKVRFCLVLGLFSQNRGLD